MGDRIVTHDKQRPATTPAEARNARYLEWRKAGFGNDEAWRRADMHDHQTTDTLPSTMHDHRPAAEVCRERGWRVGQRLVGDEGHGPTVIEITVVGEATILAKTISHNGEPAAYSREGGWALWCRDWRPA
jgi:hypothetical protein